MHKLCFILLSIFILLQACELSDAIAPFEEGELCELAVNRFGRCNTDQDCVIRGDIKQCEPKCGENEIRCEGDCIVASNNKDHCGARGKCENPEASSEDFIGYVCSSNEACREGSCSLVVCEGNESLCTTGGWFCTDLGADSRNCGYCGNDCTTKVYNDAHFTSCVNGQCQSECNEGFTKCGDSCVDIKSNIQHCGACNNDCIKNAPNDPNLRVSCVYSQCVEECGNDMRLCGNQCIDVNNNKAHCGHCNFSCDNNAPSNAYTLSCTNKECRYACNTGTKNCSTVTENLLCVANNSHATNPYCCGTKGYKCAENQYCENNTCLASTCSNGRCPLGGCDDVDTDTQCGKNCQNCTEIPYAEASSCVSGRCYVSKCAPGYHLQNNHLGCVKNNDVACATVTSFDSVNCLTLPYISNARCNSEGKCEIIACKTNYKNNNEIIEDGCESIECSSDALCLATSNVANASCVDGICHVNTCKPGFCNVDGSSANGCEQYSGQSGQCCMDDMACPDIAFRTPICVSDNSSTLKCEYKCPVGYTNCGTTEFLKCIKLQRFLTTCTECIKCIDGQTCSWRLFSDPVCH